MTAHLATPVADPPRTNPSHPRPNQVVSPPLPAQPPGPEAPTDLPPGTVVRRVSSTGVIGFQSVADLVDDDRAFENV